MNHIMMWKEDAFFLFENPALRSTEKLILGWPRLSDPLRKVKKHEKANIKLI